MASITDFLGVEKDNRKLLASAYYAFLCSGMMTTVLGAVLPSLSEEYALSYSVQGILLSMHQIGNLCAVFLAGFLPYAIGRKKSTVMGASGVVLGLVFMTLWGNPAFLIFSFLLTGMGRGTLSNATNVVVGQVAKNKAGGLNLLHACFAVGACASPLVVVAVGPESWRVPCLLISGMMFLALVFLALGKLDNRPQKKEKGSEAAFVKSPAFWLNTFIMFFYLCAEASLTGWLVTYFTDSGMFPQSVATSMQTLLWLMILTGRLVCASVSNKMSKPLLITILGVVMTAFFVLMISASSGVVAAIGVFGVGMSMSGIYPTTLSTMPSAFNSSTVATGTCIAVATIGAIAMPMIIGAVAEVAGIAFGVALIAFALAVMLVLMFTKLILTKKGKLD